MRLNWKTIRYWTPSLEPLCSLSSPIHPSRGCQYRTTSWGTVSQEPSRVWLYWPQTKSVTSMWWARSILQSIWCQLWQLYTTWDFWWVWTLLVVLAINTHAEPYRNSSSGLIRSENLTVHTVRSTSKEHATSSMPWTEIPPFETSTSATMTCHRKATNFQSR